MDINNAASSRAAYYDRGALLVSLTYSALAVAPHGQTVQDTYTVPANRKALISGISIDMNRDLAAPGNLRWQTRVYVIPTVGLPFNIIQQRSYRNGIGADASCQLAPAFTLYPGDEVQLLTIDSNAGGTVSYANEITITEFDF